MKKSVLLLGLLVACGGDDGGNPQIITPDAPGGGSGNVDAPAANCTLAAELGTVTPTQLEAQFAIADGETEPGNYWVIGDINQDPMPDVLWVDLYDGFGAFTNGLPTAPTTVQLTDAETSFESCGACVYAWGDFTQQGSDDYFATSGTLQLTSVSRTKITGMLTNVTLTHVNIDQQSGATTPHPDGCSSNLTSFSFDAVPTEFMPPMAQGAPQRASQRWKLHLKKQK